MTVFTIIGWSLLALSVLLQMLHVWAPPAGFPAPDDPEWWSVPATGGRGIEFRHGLYAVGTDGLGEWRFTVDGVVVKWSGARRFAVKVAMARAEAKRLGKSPR